MGNALDLLLLTAAAGILMSPIMAGAAFGRWLLTLLYVLQFGLLWQIDPHSTITSDISFSVMGHMVGWQMDALGWFFAIITLGAAIAASAYAAGEWGDKFISEQGSIRWLYVALQLNVIAMLLLLSSADLLSLFIGWELTSWSGLLLMVLHGPKSIRAGMRYITYAMAGGMAIFAAFVITYSLTGSMSFETNLTSLSELPSAQLWLIVLLFVAGFSVKMGMLPFHLWQAPAYALTAGPASAFLGAISSRMGLFGIALVIGKLIGIAYLSKMFIWFEQVNLQLLLAWVAALTIILPTYTALRQNDARMLLAWHGIGQGGYMMLGLLMADSMGSAGGLLHVFNYAACQAALLMSVFAVVHRTGTADLNSLGGLIARMPLTFLVMLIGIIGLAGLPPMNGFVSKWLVYRSLVNEGMPLLFVASVIGTLGTILSVYKLLHNTFLGQLRAEHENIKEVPWSMLIPMLLLCVVIFVSGLMPGLVLEYVAAAQAAIGLPVVNYHLGGIESPSGSLNMLWIIGILFSGFGIGAVLFYGFGGKSKRVHQLDNYAGGHFLTADNQYQYSANFYAGLMHQIKPLYRSSFTWLESAVESFIESSAMMMQGLYRQIQPALWALGGTTILLLWVMWHALG